MRSISTWDFKYSMGDEHRGLVGVLSRRYTTCQALALHRLENTHRRTPEPCAAEGEAGEDGNVARICAHACL